MSATIENVANKSFDYIVVGGGTAGLTVAAGLSKDPNTSVLVLEAGEANLNDPNLLRPASWGSHFGNKSYAWDYALTDQKHVNGPVRPWYRGKGLGGSSGINFLCYTKPPAEEIDDIERLGNPGWNWNTVQGALEKVEGFVPPSEEFQKRNLLNFDNWTVGRDGPLTLAFPGKVDKGELQVQQTFLNAGIPIAPNPVSGDPKGTFFTLNTYDPQTHTRTYATTAFYLPNRDRHNLSVLVAAPVNKVLTDKSNGKITATGVEFQHAGKVYTVNANKEVILSAGALKTPQILELSGFGQKEVLQKIGVPLVKELPGIGNNAQEHTFAGISWELKDDVELDTIDLLRDPAVAAKHLELHAAGSGLFTIGIIGFTFASLDQVSPKASEVIKKAKEQITKKMESASPSLRDQWKIQLERLDRGAPGVEYCSVPGLLSWPNPPEPGKRYLSILSCTNHFFSRGTVHSISSDPNEEPEIDPHYFEEDIDGDILVEQVKFARNLANISPLKDMIVKEINPGPEVNTDAEIAQWAKRYSSTTYHTAGTCSMLPEDKDGVVDPELKVRLTSPAKDSCHHLQCNPDVIQVYGTDNLRIVDMSILPLQFAAHPQAFVYGLGQRAVDLITGSA
ncbi:alcohol oxidase [Panus rudis PR-1116 ss-1]|nr:alcohol oxidase [Panus rudis PR-1116 ss-1]